MRMLLCGCPLSIPDVAKPPRPCRKGEGALTTACLATTFCINELYQKGLTLQPPARNSEEAAKLLGDVDDYYVGKLVLEKFDFAKLKDHINSINGLVTNFKEFVDSASEVMGQYERVDLSEEEIVSKVELSQNITRETVNLIKNLAVSKPNGRKHIGLFVKTANRTYNLSFRIAIVDCIRKHLPSCPKTVDVDLLNAWWKEFENPK